MPSTGTFDRKAEKKRSPFAAFKRADSSRDLQIPESPPLTATDRPGTSFTDQSSLRNPSVSQDHAGLDTAATEPEVHPESPRNGAAPEGFTNNHVNQVNYQPGIEKSEMQQPLTSLLFSHTLIQKGLPSALQQLTRSRVPRMKQRGR